MKYHLFSLCAVELTITEIGKATDILIAMRPILVMRDVQFHGHVAKLMTQRLDECELI